MAERPSLPQRDFPNLTVVRAGEARTSAPEPGLTRKVLAYNDKLFLVEHHLENWNKKFPSFAIVALAAKKPESFATR